MFAAFDPWIVAFSLATVVATIWMGFRSARTSKSASDFFVAGRSVSVGWNASAISGEYLSAASFMGVAGMVMSSGYDALWYPVCYACGYLFLLLFIAGPLRRFGAYTIPDFAEGRFDSPLFRKIAVIFVLFIGFFYTMPQMKGAGTTLAYIFPGLPYWMGVVLVGAVITLNVALGGMKGITLVQAFQYWAKMFAISVPIFVLMSVYGHYGKQLERNAPAPTFSFDKVVFIKGRASVPVPLKVHPNWESEFRVSPSLLGDWRQQFKRAESLKAKLTILLDKARIQGRIWWSSTHTYSGLSGPAQLIGLYRGCQIAYPLNYESTNINITVSGFPGLRRTTHEVLTIFEEGLIRQGFCLLSDRDSNIFVIPNDRTNRLGWVLAPAMEGNAYARPAQPPTALKIAAPANGPGPEKPIQSAPLPELPELPELTSHSPVDFTDRPAELDPQVAFSLSPRRNIKPVEPDPVLRPKDEPWSKMSAGPWLPTGLPQQAKDLVRALRMNATGVTLPPSGMPLTLLMANFYRETLIPKPDTLTVYFAPHLDAGSVFIQSPLDSNGRPKAASVRALLAENGFALVQLNHDTFKVFPAKMTHAYEKLTLEDLERSATGKAPSPTSTTNDARPALAATAPANADWINPFGPLTTKAAKPAAAAAERASVLLSSNSFERIQPSPPVVDQLQLSVRFAAMQPAPSISQTARKAKDDLVKVLRKSTNFHANMGGLGGTMLLKRALESSTWLFEPNQPFTNVFLSRKLLDHHIKNYELAAGDEGGLLNRFIEHVEQDGVAMLKNNAAELWVVPLAEREDIKGALTSIRKPIIPRAYALLYTYSLIIALVCGTAGLPHILVRFYTNPDGVAAKRTTMWVMILIGIFYVFPPVFGVIGRNLMPELYTGLSGIKGTDQVVLKLPTLLSAQHGVLGSILSGITCAGAFAAFMSTFSGLLVSMTGALAHDVYGRILRPQSTPADRLRMFKWCAVLIGTVAMVLGSFVEPLQINFMVGQSFAIAAASYFPLLFMSVWWRGMTMRGAAAGMLTGGICALAAVTLTNFSDLKWIALGDFWAAHPLLRILCEQPAIWTVPLAISLMVIVSKLTRSGVPADIRMKMLVLHAPEKFGLKQEYIREQEAHGH